MPVLDLEDKVNVKGGDLIQSRAHSQRQWVMLQCRVRVSAAECRNWPSIEKMNFGHWIRWPGEARVVGSRTSTTIRSETVNHFELEPLDIELVERVGLRIS